MSTFPDENPPYCIDLRCPPHPTWQVAPARSLLTLQPIGLRSCLSLRESRSAWAFGGRLEEDIMGVAIVAMVLLIVLDLAALRWGYDSRDGFQSPEWTRRRLWRVDGEIR